MPNSKERKHQMNIKKITLLASMAFAAMAFAGTASASANSQYALYDVDNNQTLTGHTEISLTGTEKFQALGSGIECEVHDMITHEASGGGTVLDWYKSITVGSCEGSANCIKVAQSKAIRLTNNLGKPISGQLALRLQTLASSSVSKTVTSA
jgi:hypothetical protein